MAHITVEIKKKKKGEFLRKIYAEGKTQTKKLNELIDEYLKRK